MILLKDTRIYVSFLNLETGFSIGKCIDNKYYWYRNKNYGVIKKILKT